MKKCIGIIGFGNMGSAAAKRFKSIGYSVYGWNRSIDKVSKINGVKTVRNPEELPIYCKKILILVSDDEASLEILFGKNGLIHSKYKDFIVINSSTISPLHSIIAYKTFKDAGIGYVDAPIMGGPRTLLNASSLIIVDGDDEVFEDASTVLKEISKDIYYVNEPPRASVIKLILNSIAFINTQALSEALTLAKAWNIPYEMLREAASKTWLKTIFDKYMDRILDEKYMTSFKLRLAAKDLFYTEAAGYYKSIALPLISTVKDIFLEASRHGYSDSDYTRVFYFISKGLSNEENSL